jgi:ketosteroid isomerase-like protein
VETAKDFVTRLFSRWEQGDGQSFVNALAEDVRWTAIGTTPISGTWRSRAEYLAKVYRPLFALFAGPVRCQVRKIIGEGNTVVVQWHGEAPTRSGRSYIQEYCWVIGVEGEAIKEVYGYFDTAAVRELVGKGDIPIYRRRGE